ncbi:Conserved oligomeric Golgi complex subunit 6 [Trichinella nativa]|uniref:Conserved oligomeric Golgi complex subunit 6 n=1 Tax=Trichinella nativa TaxID=6335 RepID=A0A0V1L2S0_9BILA|nr:Conserved oligomeric Golgi complex subunit 6 [Trichinella nativa]
MTPLRQIVALSRRKSCRQVTQCNEFTFLRVEKETPTLTIQTQQPHNSSSVVSCLNKQDLYDKKKYDRNRIENWTLLYLKSPMSEDSTIHSHLAMDVSRVLQINLNPDMLKAFKTLSLVCGDKSASVRQNLQNTLDNRILSVNKEICDNFSALKARYDDAMDLLNEMEKSCSTMSNHLRDTRKETVKLINQIAKLRKQIEYTENSTSILNNFLSEFQLKAEELDALKSSTNENLSPNFFLAIKRAEQIHAAAKQLSLSGTNTVGLSIVENMAEVMRSAFDTLYHFIQTQCRRMTSETVSIGLTLCEAFMTMQKRCTIFEYSLEEFCSARRSFLIHIFIDSLSKSSDSRIKPIESYSHDPLHYIGDMLALIHQATVNEKELLLSLLKLCDKSVLEKYIPLALSKITDGLSRPFKIRAEQTLARPLGPVILYQLYVMFHFHLTTVGEKLSKQSELRSCLDDCEQLAMKLFQNCLNTKVCSILKKFHACQSDLVPVQGVSELLQLLRDVLHTPSGTTVLHADDKKRCYSLVFASVIDPMLQTLTMYSTDLSPVDFATYMLNCINAVHSAVAMYEFSDQRLEMLQAQVELGEWVIEVHLGNVVNEMANYILNKVGLTEAYKKALDNNNSDDQRQFQLPSPDFNSSLEKFYTFLNSPETLFMPQFFKIISPTIQNKVKGKTIDALIGVYDKIQNSFHVTRHLSEIKALAALATNQK